LSTHPTTPQLYTLSLHDALPIYAYVGMVTQQAWMFLRSSAQLRKNVLIESTIASVAHLGEHAFEEAAAAGAFVALFIRRLAAARSEEHTSELQSRGHLVCRLLLE